MTPLEDIGQLFGQWYKQGCQCAPMRVAGHDRRRLIQIFGEKGLTEGAEIGVDRGRFSEFMFKFIPGLHLYCVDPWDLHYRGQSRYESSVARLDGYNTTFIRKTSLEALNEIPDESLDFVYIDGDHTFDWAMTDIIWWSKKVKFGGVVAGHDYYRFRNAGVVGAVDVYTYQHGINQWFVTDEKTPSWFWIRDKSSLDALIASKQED